MDRLFRKTIATLLTVTGTSTTVHLNAFAQENEYAEVISNEYKENGRLLLDDYELCVCAYSYFTSKNYILYVNNCLHDWQYSLF